MGPVGASSFAQAFDTSAPKRDHRSDIRPDVHACEEPMAQPLSEAEIAKVQRLHGEGASANAIARELGRSPSTITRACGRLGLSFDRSQTAAAVKAHTVDMAKRRNALAENLLADAERIREQLWKPTTVFNFGGRDNDYNEREMSEAPADVKRTLMQAATTAVNAHLRLVDYAARDNHDDAKDIVLQFGLAVRAAQLPDDDPAPAD